MLCPELKTLAVSACPAVAMPVATGAHPSTLPLSLAPSPLDSNPHSPAHTRAHCVDLCCPWPTYSQGDWRVVQEPEDAVARRLFGAVPSRRPASAALQDAAARTSGPSALHTGDYASNPHDNST